MDEDLRETLRADYCPPLDDATFYAIFDEYQSQFDLRDKGRLVEVRTTLESLKAGAIAEDTADFDPSGTGGIAANSELYGSTDTPSNSEHASPSYDVESLSTSISELVLGTGAEDSKVFESDWASMSQEHKIDRLVELFSSMDRVTISNTIRNSKGNLNFCMETLLNLSFMSSNGPDSDNREPILQKGIDGFADGSLSHRGRKQKGKRKGLIVESTRSSSTASATDRASTPVRNAWFSPDEQQIPAEPGHTQIVPQYARPNLSSEEETSAPASPASTMHIDKIQAKNRAIAHGLAGQAAFAQASAAVKRGRSDRLINAAAVVYAEKGHEHRARQRELESAAASAHVAQQSTHNTTDLHGVRVHDAVQIARERTLRWWDGLGDAKFLGDGGPAKAGFRIVTGIGRHSKDGAPKIGPAVWKALVNEGWKASVESGEILVTGRKRR